MRKDSKPVLIEFKTFRMKGHEEASGQAYIDNKIIEEWSKKDPISHFEDYLLTSKFISSKDLVEIKKKKNHSKKSKEPSFIKSVYKVLFADITISFDNVIGVVGAAKGYFGFMIFGLVLSVVLTGALATYMAKYIQQHIWIAYVGLIFILIVGLQLIIGWLVDLEILNINEEFKKYF